MKNVLIAPAAFYFFFFAALAAMSPFLALYYQGLGLSGGEIGLLLGVSPLVSLFASPFWTGLADARHRHKTILFITILTTILFAVVFPSLKTFAFVFLFVLLLAFVSAPIIPLVDTAAISMLGERRELYGRTRLWGTIGWGVSAPLAGMFLQIQGLRWLFWVYALLMTFNLFIVPRISFSRPVNVTPFWHGLRIVFTDRRWVFFLFTVFVAGIGIAVHANYLSLLLQYLGADKTLVGFAVTITMLSELPVMFFSNRPLKRLKPNGLLIIATTVVGLRCLFYAFSLTPLTVLFIQLAHGFTYPALWIAGVTYAAENAPAGLESTSQGIFGSVLAGFGMSAGSLLGGMFIDSFGITRMYLYIGLMVLAVTVILFIVQYQSGQSHAATF
jgi:PPP family 3-phenylpropionic acid transporter